MAPARSRTPWTTSRPGSRTDDRRDRWSAALEPVEAVEDEVERELELEVVVAFAEGTVVGDGEGHLRDVGEGGAEFAGDGGGRLGVDVGGVVEKLLGEPEQAAAEDVQGVMCLCDG